MENEELQKKTAEDALNVLIKYIQNSMNVAVSMKLNNQSEEALEKIKSILQTGLDHANNIKFPSNKYDVNYSDEKDDVIYYR